jgi:hypothetical protein
MVGIRIYDELSIWQVLFNQKDADRHNDDVLVAMHDSWDALFAGYSDDERCTLSLGGHRF